MNIKRILIGLGIASIIFATISSFCDAGYVGEGTSFSLTTSYQQLDLGNAGCILNKSSISTNTITVSLDGTNNNTQTLAKATLYCYTGIIYVKASSNTSNFQYFLNIADTCPTCPTCDDPYTSLECQTEYSLIPVSDVTVNYCTSNFDLISPSDCPLSDGTGATQWSALRLNNVQYAGASNIYINISDLLDYSTTYTESGSSFVLDVDGYVADTGYLNDILTVQEYHPNSEDFTMSFVGALTLGLPYVMVALFVVFVRKLIKKIFKS